jgi:hypothetical protein
MHVIEASGNVMGNPPPPSSPGVVASSPVEVSAPGFPPSLALFVDDDEHAVASATAHETMQMIFAFLMARPSADQSPALIGATLPDEMRRGQSLFLTGTAHGRT